MTTISSRSDSAMGTSKAGELEPESAAVVRQLTGGAAEVLDHTDLAQLRAKMSAFMKSCAPRLVPVKAAEKRLIKWRGGKVAAIVYSPLEQLEQSRGTASDGARPILLYFHGGGFTHFSAETHDPIARYLCNKASCIVVNVDYRLAPENKFPAALADAYEMLCWVETHARELGGDPRKIVVNGESAGGTISISLCLMTRQDNGPRIALQIPMCPALTLEQNHNYPSWKALGGGEYLITPQAIEDIASLYLRRPRDRLDPLASPILAPDLSGLPPALILTAQFDPLVDEAAHYARRLRDAGVPVTYKCFEGTIHSFMIMAGVISRGYSALDLVASRVAEL
jgi:acetyl esterase